MPARVDPWRLYLLRLRDRYWPEVLERKLIFPESKPERLSESLRAVER